ncbi:MAG TPA: rhamnulokinase family protein [Propionicimonas sp.]|nr:rhamnulokinase family protein [Propionicimonas sp.]HRA06301.1 rhamnulokinase family protein [Propionicimonas sp.]
MTARYFAAADLGASSGRVILGKLEDGRFELSETVRFENGPVDAADGIHTDARGLFEHVCRGIEVAIAASGGALESVGVDTWGVDYGRLDASGELLESPFHYRDDRTTGVPELVFAELPAAQLYASAGLQVMAFNTIFQLVAARDDARWGEVSQILLTPDLLSYWLCGRRAAEVTIASTTGLLDVATRTWSDAICAHLAEVYRLPVPRVLPELVEPGTVLGATTPGLFSRLVQVVAVGGHDTASAVASIPATTTDFAFISSGTWSLVGLELEQPVLSEASRAADFTNELGIDGTVRYLKNVMGLWVLSESMRTWKSRGLAIELLPLLAAAAERPGLACVLDMTDARLLPPGDMPSRLLAMAAETGQELADDPVAITRCILDSLAVAYRRTIRLACELAGREVSVVHVVGGGCQNTLLCQLTAEATGLPVIAGPAEGTALGNLLVQARAMGALSGDRTALREVAIASSELVTYQPGKLAFTSEQWADAERRALGAPREGSPSA